jgi:hypothetical protein
VYAPLATTAPRVQRKCGCSTGGDCGCGGKKKVQRKARTTSVSEPHDPLEQEADRVADAALRGTAAPVTASEPILARSASAVMPVQTALPADLSSSSGSALEEPHRAEFESRLGHDFSRVRIHDDRRAHALAVSYGARAFTYGADVFFGAGELDLHSTAGRHLLAHELAHTVQQSGGIQRHTIQRVVAPRYDELRRALSYRIVDWEITDADARTALDILQPLNEEDLTDTVGAMEDDGLVDRFFENVGQADRGAFETLLQQVQNHRRYQPKLTGGPVLTGSCSPAQGSAIGTAATTALSWLDYTIAQLRRFIAFPLSDRYAAVGASMERNFHTTNPFHAQLLETRLTQLRSQFAGDPTLASGCTAPTDTMCVNFGAHAFYSGDQHRLSYCPLFFSDTSELQAGIVLHESVHAFLGKVQMYPKAAPNVVDRGYSRERVYTMLRPEEAFDNAESYARFARELALERVDTPDMTWRRFLSALAGEPADRITGCTPEQTGQVATAVARAERRNTDVRNSISEETTPILATWEATRRRNFGTTSAARAHEIVEAFRNVKDWFGYSIVSQCDPTCPAGASAVSFAARMLHFCPGVYTLDEPERIRQTHAAAFMAANGLAAAAARPYLAVADDVIADRAGPPPPLPEEPFPTSRVTGEMIA